MGLGLAAQMGGANAGRCGFWQGKRVHLIGAGGTGMRGAARMLVQLGCRVTGSDMKDSPMLEELRNLGAVIHVGHRAEYLPNDVDYVVATAAVPTSNPERKKAGRRGLTTLKYAELLGRLMASHVGIAVAGTHGKTSTTAMTAVGLRHAGLDPSYLVGGEVPQLGGSAKIGSDELFVAEACEYDRSFLNLWPRYAIVTNVDRDHLDCYGHMGAIVDAFAQFCAQVDRDGCLVVNGEDKNLAQAVQTARCPVETFGFGHAVDWRIVDRQRAEGMTRFLLRHGSECYGPFQIRYPGDHYVLNAAGAVILCYRIGVPLDTAAEAIASYAGVGRRFELLGTALGVRIIDDYAHHPREVRVTLEAAREEFPGRRIWCVFQPHQYSRTRLLLDEFATAFEGMYAVIVPDIYSARDSEDDRRSVSAGKLAAKIGDEGVPAMHMPCFDEIVERLAEEVEPGDVVITMGAGPVNEVGQGLLARLEETEAEGAYLETVGSNTAA